MEEMTEEGLSQLRGGSFLLLSLRWVEVQANTVSCCSPPPHSAVALEKHWVKAQGDTQLFKEVFPTGASPGKGLRGASGHQYRGGELCCGSRTGPNPAVW